MVVDREDRTVEPRRIRETERFRRSGYALGAVGSVVFVLGASLVGPWLGVLFLGLSSMPLTSFMGAGAAWVVVQNPAIAAIGLATSVTGSVMLAGAAWLARDRPATDRGGPS